MGIGISTGSANAAVSSSCRRRLRSWRRRTISTHISTFTPWRSEATDASGCWRPNVLTFLEIVRAKMTPSIWLRTKDLPSEVPVDKPPSFRVRRACQCALGSTWRLAPCCARQSARAAAADCTRDNNRRSSRAARHMRRPAACERRAGRCRPRRRSDRRLLLPRSARSAISCLFIRTTMRVPLMPRSRSL